MLALFFQSHFHCFLQSLDFLHCKEHFFLHFINNWPAESFTLCWYVIFRSFCDPLMLLLYFCRRVNSNKINKCRIGSSLFSDIYASCIEISTVLHVNAMILMFYIYKNPKKITNWSLHKIVAFEKYQKSFCFFVGKLIRTTKAWTLGS